MTRLQTPANEKNRVFVCLSFAPNDKQNTYEENEKIVCAKQKPNENQDNQRTKKKEKNKEKENGPKKETKREENARTKKGKQHHIPSHATQPSWSQTKWGGTCSATFIDSNTVVWVLRLSGTRAVIRPLSMNLTVFDVPRETTLACTTLIDSWSMCI